MGQQRKTASRRSSFIDGIRSVRRQGLWLRIGRYWYHPLHGRIPAIGGGTSASFTQTHARFRNDDGSETTATWKANEDVSIVVPISALDTNIRLRIQVDETAGGSSANFVGQLRYSRNGGAYTDVTGTSTVARASASSNFTDEAATTNQLTAPTGTFLTGAMDEANGAAGTTQVDFAAGQFTEFEWCFQIRSADVARGDTIDFRCYRSTNALNVYSVTLRAHIGQEIAVPEGSVSAAGQATLLALGVAVGVGALAFTGLSVGVGFKAPDVGAITITGQAPTLTEGQGPQSIPVPAGSVSVVGQPPILSLGVSAGSGSIAVTGLSPALLSGLEVPAGSIAIAGQTPALLLGIEVPVGSVSVTGQLPAILGGGSVAVPVGSITLIGQTLILAHGILVPAGSVIITGQTPTVSNVSGSPSIAVPAGSTIIAGQLVGVAFKAPPTGSVAFTGLAPALSLGGAGVTISVPAGTITVAGNFVSVSFLGPDTGSITFAGQVPQILAGTGIPVGSITIAGNAPLVSIVPATSPGPGLISAQGQTPNLGLGIGMMVGSAFYTGLAPSVVVAEGALSVPVGSITITGLAPTLSLVIPIPAAALVITATVPVVGYGIPVPAGSITIAGALETLAFGIYPQAGSISIAGLAPASDISGLISVGAGSIAITGLAPTLGEAVEIPAGTIIFNGHPPSPTTQIQASIPVGSIVITGLAPTAVGQIIVPTGTISFTGRTPAALIGGNAPTNQTACTALNLRPMGVTQFQDVHDNGVTFSVWYYITAEEGDVVFDVFGRGSGIISGYRPGISIWTGPDCNNLSHYLDINTGNSVNPVPTQFPVNPGQTYWVLVTTNSPTVSPANLEITARLAPQSTAPRGSILVPDDTDGFAAAILSATTGEPIRFKYPFPAGESAYILENGYILTEDRSNGNVVLFAPDLTLVSTIPFVISSSGGGISGRGDKFYVARDIGATDEVKTVNIDGTFGPTTWVTSGTNDAIAVSLDHSVLFIGPTSGNIKRWDLINDVALPDLPGTAPPSGWNRSRQMLVLADGTLLVSHFLVGGSSYTIKRFNSSTGALLNSYPFTGLVVGLIRDNQIALSLDDPNSFMVWLKVSQGLSQFKEIRTSDGVVLNSTPPVVQYESGVYQVNSPDTPTQWFGHSESCPFVILRFTISDELVSQEAPELDIDGEFLPSFDSICIRIERRLGDLSNRIWSAAEVDAYLLQAVREMCTHCRLIWDWVYPENLPRGFSFTAPWEKAFIDAGDVLSAVWKYGPGDGMGDGLANYTFDDERRMYPTLPVDAQTRADEDIREGPARHTHPDEIPFLHQLRSDHQQPTADLPHRLTELERSLWDKRTIEAQAHRFVAPHDSRYEIERGEVHSYTWRKDGPRTFRKIRVPNELADVFEIDGLWGIARDLSDVTGAEKQGTWGIPRIIPEHHPIGPFFTFRMWGTPRRIYRDGKNVRVEHWRIPFLDCFDSELPPRYRHYLVYYAMWRCLSRQGPGQDFKLANWYRGRWNAALSRINRRINRQTQERTGRMGGSGEGPSGRPPRPRLPWQYGNKIR